MKVIKETEFCTIVERSYDKNNKMAMAYVTESATNFYVTIKVIGYAMPSVHKWKVSKKDAEDDHQAALLIAKEAFRRGNL